MMRRKGFPEMGVEDLGYPFGGLFGKQAYRGFIGMMERNMEATIEGLGFRVALSGVPIIRIIVFLESVLGSPCLWKLPSICKRS